MATSSRVSLREDAQAEADEPQRWPVPASALLVVGLSAALWSLLIAGLRLVLI